MSVPTVWCPSCGAEYTVGSRYCSDCRVELVAEAPPGDARAAAPRPGRIDAGARGDDEDDEQEDDEDDDNVDDDNVDDDNDDDDDDDGSDATDLVELGDFPRLAALILRRRLETAGLSVMVEWTGPGGDATGTILVPEGQAEFAEAVINEIEVDDEVPDTSPEAYIIRIEEHLSTIGALLDELRTRFAQG